MANGDEHGVTHDLLSLLSSADRNFLLRNNGDQVEISSLTGKIVGLYFSATWCGPCLRFTPDLVEVHQELAAKGDFEVVFISSDRDEESYTGYFSKMPWLSIPFWDSETRKRLKEFFKVRGIPNLVIIDANGKVSIDDGTKIVRDYGANGYPFTAERFAELVEIEKAEEKAQTLESILISGDRNFVIGKDGTQIPVADLVGKNILLYFSAHWCPPCRAFLPTLVEAYHEIKAKDDAFEVIFISSDRDQDSFDEFFATMPWLALPFGDSRKAFLSRKFKVQGIPMLVAIGPTGQTVTREARNHIMAHGAKAYPFTEEHLEAESEEMAKGWPEKLKSALHEKHELVLSKRTVFVCDGCRKPGALWSFCCKECDFDLHPKCAFEGDKKTENDGKQEGEESKEG
ncbi:hypothetical protein ACFX15_020681 [Malus domestica]|uniref:probable nucleoredoxin 1 n=1 Tax=Malus domestica TaxID=3750 RepID=UPI0004988F3E|nr:probable nucleoredoxin 1 [Malus domestica]